MSGAATLICVSNGKDTQTLSASFISSVSTAQLNRLLISDFKWQPAGAGCWRRPAGRPAHSLFRAGSAQLFSDNSIVSLKLQGVTFSFVFSSCSVLQCGWTFESCDCEGRTAAEALGCSAQQPQTWVGEKKNTPFTSGNERDERRRQGLQGRAKYKTHVGLYLCTRFLSLQLQPRCATITKS